MSTSSNVPLGSLRLQAQQRTGLENNPVISTSEWNTYATSSYKELYDMLISAYGNDYYVAQPYTFQTTSAQSYALPDGSPSYQTSGSTSAKFYKLLGVDLQYSASPSGYVTLRNFEFIERNKYATPNAAVGWVGYTNLRYRLSGNNLYFNQVPTSGQSIRVWYAPAPTNLQFVLPTVTAAGGSVCSVSDTTGLFVGMSVSGSGIQDNTTITAVASTSFTISQQAASSQASAILSMWSDSTTLDGISGWEEYIVLDMAIKAIVKQELDPSGFAAQQKDMKQRIESMAEGRDIGQAFHVSDALGANSWAGDFGLGGWGWGDGGML